MAYIHHLEEGLLSGENREEAGIYGSVTWLGEALKVFSSLCQCPDLKFRLRMTMRECNV